jgi:hypothetical protein
MLEHSREVSSHQNPDLPTDVEEIFQTFLELMNESKRKLAKMGYIADTPPVDIRQKLLNWRCPIEKMLENEVKSDNG